MKVSEVMTSDVQTCGPSDSIVDVAMKMRDLDVGSIPIVDSNQGLRGIITDRDIVIRGVAQNIDLAKEHCANLMTTDLFHCREDTDVHQVADIMAEHQIRRLPVVDAENRLVGICAIGDLALEQIFVDDAGEALSDISQPTVH